MINKIKNFIFEKMPTLYEILVAIREIKYYVWDYIVLNKIVFNVGYAIRKRSHHTKYEKIKDFQNIHEGEKCCIVATGPSLKMSDLDVLKQNNVKCFSMNSIVHAFQYTDWRPDYYCVFDNDVVKRIGKLVKEENFNTIFVSGNEKRLKKELDKAELDNLTYFALNRLNHSNALSEEQYKTSFSGDVYLEVFDSGSIAYVALQLAVYMGFKEIYLLGADCDFTNMLHFQKDPSNEVQEGKEYSDRFIKRRRIIAEERYMRIMTGYREAKKYAEENKIKIYNATRGGKLEVFERVDFDRINWN